MRTRIRARFVVGFDGVDHVVYERGEVVYERDRVVFVGHGYGEPVDEEVDAGDALVGPGFVDLDALADIDHAVFDSYQTAELGKGLLWAEDYFLHRRRDVFGRDDEAFQRRYALVQLLLNGVTTAMPIAAETHKGWAETREQFLDVAEAAGELGLRMYLGPSYRSGVVVARADGEVTVAWDEAEGERGFAEAVRFAREIEGRYEGRLRGALLPCRIETMAPELLRRSKQAADELGCPLRIHASQGPTELRLLDGRYGKRPIELLDELGFLGPRTSIPHVIYGSPHELRRMRETGTSVIHCPIASGRYGRVRPIDVFLEAGVNVAMGTDTFPPDLIRAMDYGSVLAKTIAADMSAGRAANLYRAATLGGAQALGRDDLGRLAPGAKADLVVVDLGDLRTGPIDDPIRTLLFNSSGRRVRTVVVDGRTVVRDGAIPGLDEEAMRRRGQAWFDEMKAHYPERDHVTRPLHELMPPTFRTVRG